MIKGNKDLIDKYLGYTRVSSKDQALGLSLDEQKNQIQKYAQNRELAIADWYGGVESAFTPGREEFQEAIRVMKKERYKGIIFHKADRSGRNPSDQGKLYELMLEGYEFHFVTENISTKEHTGRQTLYFMWAVASGYSENLQIEVRKGRGALLRLGRFPHACPVGYLDTGHGIKILDPKLAPLVKKAFEIYAKGHHTIPKLHKEMTKLGLTRKHGQELRPKDFYKILRKKFYYGCVEVAGQTYIGTHSKLIDKKLFDDVQYILDERSFKHHRKFWYYFQHMVNCPVCDKPLRCLSAKRKYKYYSCRNLACKTNLKEETIEDQFFKDLLRLEFDDSEVKSFLKAVEVFRKDLKMSKEDEIKHLDMELAKLKAEKERLLTNSFKNMAKDASSFLLMKHNFNALTAKGPLNRILEMEWNTQLPDQVLSFVDALSMAHSVEIRSPFLDYRLVEFAATVRGDTKIRNGNVKDILKHSLKALLPEEIIKRPKEGFVLPVFDWMVEKLKDFCMDVLSENRLRRHGFLNADVVKDILGKYCSGERGSAARVWNLMMFQLWWERYFG